MEFNFRRVAIIGVGLIGGSLGMAAIGRGLAERVVGIDSNEEALQIAIETQAIHKGFTSISQGVAEADLVVVATPVGMTLDIIKECIPYIKKGCIITDVGSTKELIVKDVSRTIKDIDIEFIGGHPMAGSEKAGIWGADRYLFENAVYILTPTEDTSLKALGRLKSFVKGLGARVLELDPGEHDLMVAAVSHLPHLLAAALVNATGNINQEHEKTLMLAAGGFRDTTRIAASHPLMWRDIFLTNKDKILASITEFRKVLDEFEGEILAGNGESLVNQLERAKAIRQSIPAKMKGYLPTLFEIVVTVPDEPGVIAKIASILGEEQINITDIEILRVREGEGGTIRLGFAEEQQQEVAVKVLLDRGILAKKR